MNLHIISVGKLKASAEKTLCEDYASRFRKTGRALGFRSLSLVEVDSGPSLEVEGERLLAKIPVGAQVIRLDEHGEGWPSVRLSRELAVRRDRGETDLVFLIGGAEGYSAAVHAASPLAIAFGPQTWPHRLVKVMLAEQIYRAATILAGTPYHKA